MVSRDNTYNLAGIAADIADGPINLDPNQLDLAVELVSDAAEWSGDKEVLEALEPSETLGWLVSYVLRRDKKSDAPEGPFDAEEEAWRKILIGFEDRLQEH
jgi:hypothetical protein